MSFGQFASRFGVRDKGWKNEWEALENAHRKYIRKSEQLADEPEEVVWSRKRGATAVVYETASGRKVYKLYDTRIVERDGDVITLNTGGWHTPTTRSHMMGALAEDFGKRATVWGWKGRGSRNLLRSGDREWTFDKTISIPAHDLLNV